MYKRQIRGDPVEYTRIIQFLPYTCLSSVIMESIPCHVPEKSHLDVYKRQPISWAKKILLSVSTNTTYPFIYPFVVVLFVLSDQREIFCKCCSPRYRVYPEVSRRLGAFCCWWCESFLDKVSKHKFVQQILYFLLRTNNSVLYW